MDQKRLTLFAGHYGSGKTNLAVNYALELARAGQKTLIADLDIVNPYFRTRDSEDELDRAGVEIIVSPYANSNVDVPALPPEMYRVTDDRAYHAVVDVGGDDRGALALGRLSPALREENNYDMRFVVNFYRPLTQTAEAALGVPKRNAKEFVTAKITSAISIFDTAGRISSLRRGRISSTFPVFSSSLITAIRTLSPTRGFMPLLRKTPFALHS